jgi:hypothetical protein
VLGLDHRGQHRAAALDARAQFCRRCSGSNLIEKLVTAPAFPSHRTSSASIAVERVVDRMGVVSNSIMLERSATEGPVP